MQNTSFFHGTLKKKRRQLAVRGVFKNEEWIEDPHDVKAEFLMHFSNRFQHTDGIPPTLDGDMPNHLSSRQSDYFENHFFCDEIKRAIWDCGGDRAPGPDGFTFKNFTTFWDVSEADVIRFVQEFFLTVKLGFGTKWRKWIFGCLWNARSSVLVNTSHTCEFKIYKGLRQGDPLSPFLFILAIEGLHVLTCKAELMGLFKGASFGQENMSVSHLTYADDVIFLGVEVLDEEISNLAKVIGCGAAKFPLKYLRVPVGGNMARCSNWNAIIQMFSFKLSLWKAHLLSVGGRLFLLKSVLGSLPTYYMSIYMMPATVQKKLEAIRNKFFIGGDLEDKKITWVRWKKCLANKDLGGLGIGSIYGLNIRLLFTWVWRFLCSSSALWVRVIKNIYGDQGGIMKESYTSSNTTWSAILSSFKLLKQEGIDLLSLSVRKIGNGVSCRFWEDTWVGNLPLKEKFTCIYQLDTIMTCSIADHLSVQDWGFVLR
nr:hypothetical protein [Tanacetum cinerariifolium]GEY47340.1 hypothetical protein [Tanacetum cinerariifolium]